MMKIIEITKENWDYYRTKILDLENKVKNDMIKQGIGDLFFTTGEEIKDYAYNPKHHVYIMIDENNNILAQTYIIGAGSHIQGDYADLPKYYTMGDCFLNYIKKYKYENKEEFEAVGSKMYLIKLYAFKYAIKKIYGNLDIDMFLDDLNNEKKSKTHFDERTKLRRDINKYMSEFMNNNGIEELYRQFFNINSSYFNNDSSNISQAYDVFLESSKINVYSTKIENPEEYYDASVNNTIEVDTYITDPESRKGGLAKILSSMALIQTIKEYFNNQNNNELFLSITLHKDNYLSENVAHFLGFKDYIDLERRATIERKAYMKRIDRHQYQEYISNLLKKLSYFYGYGNETLTDYEINYFEMERKMHNNEILEEINRRLKEEIFDEHIKRFIENFKTIINNTTIKQLIKK